MNTLQQKQFELLSCFVRICDRLGIPYYLVCGSALGAVKYSGFIPWDDDVDVGLLRPDYQRFLQEAPALLPEGLFLQTFRSDPEYPHVFAKLRDSRTTFAESAVDHRSMNHGIFIDVFPLDGYPVKKREKRQLERRKKRYKRWLLTAFSGDFSLKTRIILRFLRLLGVHRRTQAILARYEKLISAYDVHTSPLICNHGNWQGVLEYAPREQYGKGRDAVFEGLRVRIPADAEAYLNQKYGDFRADPPPAMRVGHHICSVVDPDTPFDRRLTAYGRKSIKCLVHYDLPDSGEERVCHLAAYAKSNYLFHCFKQLHYENHVLSASPTRGSKSVGKRVVQLDETTVLELLPAAGRGSHLHNGLHRVGFNLRLFGRLMRLVQPGETLWAYHSLGLIPVLRWLKRCKRFRLILELEELYGDVSRSKRVTRREIRFARLADAYIFPTETLNRTVNPKGKPYVIAHGVYQTTLCPDVPHSDEQRIHVVYAGTLDPRKGGASAAIGAAQYLPQQYHVHILGTGNPTEMAAMLRELSMIQATCSCTITYDGVLSGKAYTDFLHHCHIGLSTQNPEEPFNATSFPSKILSYMACGLRVVSGRVSVVEESKVGKQVYYYDEQTPKAIAQAIQAVDVSAAYSGKELLNRLDTDFREELSRLLEQL